MAASFLLGGPATTGTSPVRGRLGRVEDVSSSLAEDGARRAEQLVRLLAEADRAAADALLADLDLRDLAVTGAGLTTMAHAESRRLPPAMRAQANSRRVRLGQLRDARRTDPDGLREWLIGAAEEVLFLRSLPAA